MFDLEQSIAQWRREMLSGGIKSPAVLDELENHLREDVETQMSSGLGEQQAFETTIRDLGQSGILKNEFAKVGGAATSHVKHFVLTLAGIPDQYVANNTDASSAGLEPRWATYFKAAAFIFPAVSLWMLNLMFVVPKFQELCRMSKMSLPAWVQTGVAIVSAVSQNFWLLSLGLILLLALLEWRAGQWPRYRRAVLGILAIVLNFSVLMAFSTMGVIAINAAFVWAHNLGRTHP